MPPKANSQRSGMRSQGSGAEGRRRSPVPSQRRSPNTRTVLLTGPTFRLTSATRVSGAWAMARPCSSTSVAGFSSVKSPAARRLLAMGSPQNTSAPISGTWSFANTGPLAPIAKVAFTTAKAVSTPCASGNTESAALKGVWLAS